MQGKLLVAVVAEELEDAAREIARSEGARGMTLLSARGMNFPEHITFFGLTYLGSETVLVALLDAPTATRIAERMNQELKLLEPFKGLAFCLPVSAMGGIDLEALHQHIAENDPAAEVEIERVGNTLVLRPVERATLADVPAIFASFSPNFMAGGREFHEQKERDWSGFFGRNATEELPSKETTASPEKDCGSRVEQVEQSDSA